MSKEGKLRVFDDGQNSTYAQPPQLESGGGGLAGTAADYMRFCRMLLSGGALDGARLLSPKTVGPDDHEPSARRTRDDRDDARRPASSMKAAMPAWALAWAWR